MVCVEVLPDDEKRPEMNLHDHATALVIALQRPEVQEVIESIVLGILAMSATTPTLERLYLPDLARRYDRASGTIRNWINAGRLPVHVDTGGKRYCLASELDEFDAWASRRKERGAVVSAAAWAIDNSY